MVIVSVAVCIVGVVDVAVRIVSVDVCIVGVGVCNVNVCIVVGVRAYSDAIIVVQMTYRLINIKVISRRLD